MESVVSYTSHEIDFEIDAEDSVTNWILRLVSENGKEVEHLDYIFCSDEFLLQMNQEHLKHDYYTDILTFPFTEEESSSLSGEIFISIDRVRENARQYKQAFVEELHRVMIHGVLHLLGQDDHGENESVMRKREQAALQLREF
ncbi:MAG: rRNA maturation RNase YbeY [Bacteroidota bacterium]